MSVDTVAVLQEHLGSLGLDQSTLDYFKDILTDFEDDEEELLDAISPFLEEADMDEDAIATVASGLWRSLCPELAGASKDEAGSSTILEAPLNMNSMHQQIDADVKKAMGWMQTKESTANADRFDNLIEKSRSKRKKSSMAEANKDEIEEVKAQKSVPSTFVKKYRPPGSVPVKQVHIHNFDVSVMGKMLIKDASLTLTYGRKYGFVGRNGAGKSSLLRAMADGEVEMPDVDFLLVEQEVVGDDTLALDSVLEADVERTHWLQEGERITAELGAADLDADRKAELETELATTYDELANIDSDGAVSVAASILAGLGFSPEMQKMTTKEFSGGWRMRLALARALFCQPDLLMLDEPTNMLDVQAVLWLEEYLRLKWTKTLFIVSHDREFLNFVVTDIIHLHQCQLHHYPGNYDGFELVRNNRLKEQQRAHDAQQAHKKHVEVFINRFRFNANRAAQVQSRIKALAKMEPIASVVEDPTFSFSFPQPVGDVAPPIIRLDNISFGYTPDKVLFPDIELNVDMDSRIAFVGGNGQGKTTILQLLTEELSPLSGFVQVNARARIAKFSQHHMDHMPLGVSAFDFLQQTFPGKDRSVYQEGLGRYGIVGDMAFQRISTLSGGQKSRVAFAHMAMQTPHLMILDEPTNHLDIDTVSVLAQALNEFTGGVVLVSHDERLIELVCDQIWVVHNGTVKKYPYDFAHYKRSLLKDIQV
eukprot:TRINITY_DN2145_c0_g1_i1.p1 TRINITY_DN2145_c0_g1~~TRINITY_DN2145_c0_g1_i1.p1  ORF type:complete len:715 (-),score=197.03 TRINITY_DN2145_c0_g1_i1:199-2319(-)